MHASFFVYSLDSSCARAHSKLQVVWSIPNYCAHACLHRTLQRTALSAQGASRVRPEARTPTSSFARTRIQATPYQVISPSSPTLHARKQAPGARSLVHAKRHTISHSTGFRDRPQGLSRARLVALMIPAARKPWRERVNRFYGKIF